MGFAQTTMATDDCKNFTNRPQVEIDTRTDFTTGFALNNGGEGRDVHRSQGPAEVQQALGSVP